MSTSLRSSNRGFFFLSVFFWGLGFWFGFGLGFFWVVVVFKEKISLFLSLGRDNLIKSWSGAQRELL